MTDPSHPGSGTDHQRVIVPYGVQQFPLRQPRAHIHMGHLREDFNSGLVNGIGDQNFCHAPWGSAVDAV